MIRKNHLSAARCRVTFEVPAEVGATTVHLCGEFNDWSETATPLTPRKGGRFSTTISLDVGRTYRYRYLVDGTKWENDWQADDYVPNGHGGDDSLVDLTSPGPSSPAPTG